MIDSPLLCGGVVHFKNTMEDWPLVVKRLLDISVTLVLLLLLCPLLLFTAIVVMTTSSGPIFFIQERVGFNKRRFRLYKFRTMVVDTEGKQSEFEHLNEVSGPVFKIKNDLRVTPIGKMLRKPVSTNFPNSSTCSRVI